MSSNSIIVDISQILLELSIEDSNINKKKQGIYELLNHIITHNPFDMTSDIMSNKYYSKLRDEDTAIAIYFDLTDILIKLYKKNPIGFKEIIKNNIYELSYTNTKPLFSDMKHFITNLNMYLYLNEINDEFTQEEIKIIKDNFLLFEHLRFYDKDFSQKNINCYPFINKFEMYNFKKNNNIQKYKNFKENYKKHKKSMITFLNDILKYIYKHIYENTNNFNIKYNNNKHDNNKYLYLIFRYIRTILIRFQIKDDSNVIPIIFKYIYKDISINDSEKDYVLSKFINFYKNTFITDININICQEKFVELKNINYTGVNKVLSINTNKIFKCAENHVINPI